MVNFYGARQAIHDDAANFPTRVEVIIIRECCHGLDKKRVGGASVSSSAAQGGTTTSPYCTVIFITSLLRDFAL